MTTGSDRARLAGLRGRLSEELANSLQSALLDPDSDLGPAGLLAYETTHEALRALTVAAHPGNPGYEDRDLPPQERVEQKQIAHTLGLLRRLRVE
jgi:hypothetical protein